jgi:uncharacterized membrane protein
MTCLKLSSILALAALTLAGCNYQVKKGEAGMISGGANKAILATVAFSDVETKVLGPYCTKCHSEFGSYAELMGANVVVPGNALGSQLFSRLKNNGGDMPARGAAQIPDEAAALVRAWIEGGAAETLTPPSSQKPPVEQPPIQQPPVTKPPETNQPPQFSEVESKVLTQYCTKCHSEFGTYKELMASGNVVPGKATDSNLFKYLKNNGGSMPMRGAMIPAAAADMIRDWINGGAVDSPTAAPVEPVPVQPAPAPAPAPAPIVNPTFTDLEAKVFSQKCTMCHSDSQKVAGFSLEKYDGIVANARLIKKGDSKNSGLFVSVSGPNAYMPPKRAVDAGSVKVLTDDEKDALKSWIDAGALRN